MVLRNNRGVTLVEVAVAMVVAAMLITPIMLVSVGYINGANKQMNDTNKTDSDNIKMFKIVQEIRSGAKTIAEVEGEVDSITQLQGEELEESEEDVEPAGLETDDGYSEDEDDAEETVVPANVNMVYKIEIGEAVQYVAVPLEDALP